MLLLSHYRVLHSIGLTMSKSAVILTLFLLPVFIMGDIRSCNDVIEHSDPRNNFFSGNLTSKLIQKREVQPIFLGHPKTKEEIWHQKFRIVEITKYIDEADVLVQLLHKIVHIYLKDCIPIVVYDKFVEEGDGTILQRFFQVFSTFCILYTCMVYYVLRHVL